MRDVTVTGTSRPVTPMQALRLEELLLGADVLRHGICINADAVAHKIAWRLGIPIIGYPGVDRDGNSPLRAREIPPEQFAGLRAARWYLDRNEDMARDCNEVIGVMRQAGVYRGGEWNCIRHGLRLGRPTTLIMPDGTLVRPPVQVVIE